LAILRVIYKRNYDLLKPIYLIKSTYILHTPEYFYDMYGILSIKIIY
jgi:hypothetical protein